MAERILTDKQLLELHDDIRDGVSMIVTVDHYDQLQAEIKRLKEYEWKYKELCI